MSSKASVLTKTVRQQVILDSSATKLGSTSAITLTSTPAAVTVASGNATLTATQVLSGLILQTPGSNSTLTLPTATALTNSFVNTQVGDTFEVRVINLSGANTTTIAADASGSVIGNGVVAVSSSGRFRVRFTNVTSGSQSYVVYVV